MSDAPPTSAYLREELREVTGTVQKILRDSAMTGGELSSRNARRVAELQDKAVQLTDRLEDKLAEETRAAKAAAFRLPEPTGSRPSDSPFSRGEVSYLSTLMYARLGDSRAQEMITAHDEYRRERLAATESRAVISSGAGALIPTVFAGGEYESYPYDRTAPLWTHLDADPLPDAGLTVEVPRFTSAASVEAQVAQGSAVADSSPSVTNVTVNVRTLAGGVTVSRQVLERATPAFDEVMFDQLRGAYFTTLESAVCSGTATASLTGIATLGTADGVNVVAMSTATTATGPAFVDKMAQGLVDLADSVYSDDAVFVMHPRRWAWLCSRSDSEGRPYVAPVAGRGATVPGSGAYGRRAGQLLGVDVITTAGIRTDFDTNQDRVVLMSRGALRAWQAAAEPQRLAVDVDAGDALMVRLSLYNYVASAAVQPSGIVVFSGAGLTNPFS